MTPVYRLRLVFDLFAAVLLLFCFSYWWLGNVAHEIAGTVLFVLLVGHNVFNRRWYRRMRVSQRVQGGWFNILATLMLMATLLTLFVTSILISKVLSGAMSAYGGFTVMQLHTLAAYWMLVLVSVHLGLRWPIVMGAARGLFGIVEQRSRRTLVLRIVAALIAGYGVWSSFQLGLGSKLSMQMTLDWWDFDESVAGFFIHCMGIAGLYISLTYYIMKSVWQRQRRAAVTEAE